VTVASDQSPAPAIGAVPATAAPAVSVLMAVYNAARYLDEAVESIRNQTFTDFEFVIINDGSTDGSEAILRHHADADPRIRLISRPNAGITRTRIELLSAARAEFVAVMDSDDVSVPTRLAKQVEYLRGHPECVAAGCKVLMIDPDGLPLRDWSLETTHDQIDRAYLERRGSAIVHPSVMMRRSAVLAVGGYDARFQTCEDQDLFLRLAEHGKLANIPEVLFKYRQHLASTCHAKVQQLWKDAEAVLAEAYTRRGLGSPGNAMPSVFEDKPVDYHRRWAWWALKAGNIATARKHAWAALRLSPMASASWRLMYCAIRGR
jgi:glycosyltransferase involved in cell wall biosynthesis